MHTSLRSTKQHNTGSKWYEQSHKDKGELGKVKKYLYGWEIWSQRRMPRSLGQLITCQYNWKRIENNGSIKVIQCDPIYPLLNWLIKWQALC